MKYEEVCDDIMLVQCDDDNDDNNKTFHFLLHLLCHFILNLTH
jgi:hypothetical protein